MKSDEGEEFRLQELEEQVHRLQQLICELLLTNQRLRLGMANNIAEADLPLLQLDSRDRE
jgi:hypothetical protein